MELFNDVNKLQADEQKKLKCIKKFLRTNNITTFKNIRYNLSALSNIINSVLNWTPRKKISILRLHKELKKKKNSKLKKN